MKKHSAMFWLGVTLFSLALIVPVISILACFISQSSDYIYGTDMWLILPLGCLFLIIDAVQQRSVDRT